MSGWACRDDDDCSGRAFCHEGSCRCFADYGTTGLPDCTTTTPRSMALLAIYVPTFLFFLRLFFIHLSLLIRYELKLRLRGPTRRLLFHLCSLAMLGALLILYGLFTAHAMGKLSIRKYDRSPGCLLTVLSAVNSLALVGWQLLIANMWYEAAQESGIYQPRTCIGRNIVRILVALGLVMSGAVSVYSLMIGDCWLFGPYALAFSTLMVLSYNFAATAVLKGYMSAIREVLPACCCRSKRDSRRPVSSSSPTAASMALTALPTIRATLLPHRVAPEGEENNDQPLEGSLADLSSRPMLARGSRDGSRQREDAGEDQPVPARAQALPPEDEQGKAEVGRSHDRANLGSDQPLELQQDDAADFAERRRHHVHGEVVRLALLLTVLAAVPAIVWTAPIRDPYTVQYTMVIGILGYVFGNVACLYYLSPPFRQHLRSRCACLRTNQPPDFKRLREQQRLRRQPV